MKKILIVEDDTEIGRMLERAFRLANFESVLLTDGESSLNYLRQTEILPDAIIMDVIMPKMSGLDLLRTIKEENNLKKIPVIVLTNSFLKENAEQFIALGADMYLVKIDHKANEIIEKVNKLINNKVISK